MPNTLPPLKALQAFEAVFRLNNFTKAAKKLNIQQPAISYQIKKLEQDLETTLFQRTNGRLVSTADASALYDVVTRSFEDISKVSARIRASRSRPIPTIATYPGLAMHWLTPRLSKVSEAFKTHPRIVTLVNDEDLFGEDADCWIVFGTGDWHGYDAHLLLSENVAPVASPVLAQKVADDFEKFGRSDAPIIVQEDSEKRWLDWAAWNSDDRSIGEFVGNPVPVNDHGLALHLATTGMGVTLGWLNMIEDLLESKALVRVDNHSIQSDAGYWLVGRKGFFNDGLGSALLPALRTEET